jgi:D-glycerate 3-kinase
MSELSQQTAAWVKSLCDVERLPDSYAKTVAGYVAPLAGRIRDLHGKLGRPVIVGINGAQGSGKSTLALFLSHWLRRETGDATACLSIDDIYLTKAERQALSHTLHPLFATRGVPGTHDTALGRDVLDAVTAPGSRRTVSVPAFDKASDDRLPEAQWPRVDAPVDVVLFEGWCVGARPQDPAELTEPINALEAKEDADAVWRRTVNERLASDYAELFGRLDMLVMLHVPSFDKVLEWRGLQEQKLRERLNRNSGSSAAPGGLSDAELLRFIQHFERLTRHMLETMPVYADAVIDIGADHGYSVLDFK